MEDAAPGGEKHRKSRAPPRPLTLRERTELKEIGACTFRGRETSEDSNQHYFGLGKQIYPALDCTCPCDHFVSGPVFLPAFKASYLSSRTSDHWSAVLGIPPEGEEWPLELVTHQLKTLYRNKQCLTRRAEETRRRRAAMGGDPADERILPRVGYTARELASAEYKARRGATRRMESDQQQRRKNRSTKKREKVLAKLLASRALEPVTWKIPACWYTHSLREFLEQQQFTGGVVWKAVAQPQGRDNAFYGPPAKILDVRAWLREEVEPTISDVGNDALVRALRAGAVRDIPLDTDSDLSQFTVVPAAPGGKCRWPNCNVRYPGSNKLRKAHEMDCKHAPDGWVPGPEPIGAKRKKTLEAEAAKPESSLSMEVAVLREKMALAHRSGARLRLSLPLSQWRHIQGCRVAAETDGIRCTLGEVLPDIRRRSPANANDIETTEEEASPESGGEPWVHVTAPHGVIGALQQHLRARGALEGGIRYTPIINLVSGHIAPRLGSSAAAARAEELRQARRETAIVRRRTRGQHGCSGGRWRRARCGLPGGGFNEF